MLFSFKMGFSLNSLQISGPKGPNGGSIENEHDSFYRGIRNPPIVFGLFAFLVETSFSLYSAPLRKETLAFISLSLIAQSPLPLSLK